MNSHIPPRWIVRFLEWFCPPSLLEEIEGDLLQKFHRDLQSPAHSQWSDDYRLRRARRKFVWNAIRFFRPEILLRNNFSLELNQLYMVRSYVMLAGRSILKNKTFSFINVLGLSVGMVVCILILQYVRFELSYDRFHTNAENIYRVATQVSLQNETILHESNTYEGVCKALKEEFPEVSVATSINAFTSDNTFVRYEDDRQNLKPLQSFKGYRVDDKFFDVFSFSFLKGDSHTALKEPYSAVISETIAERYFRSSPLGKTLEISDGEDVKRFTITGILQNLPSNSHIKFDLLIHSPEPENNFWNGKVGFWDWRGHTYVRIRDQVDVATLESKLDRLALDKNGLKTNKDDYGQVSTFRLQPLVKIHLFSHLLSELEPNGSSVLVYSLIALAIIIIIIAWINYVNLATAMSAEKIKGIGIRKIVGASRAGLIVQVLTESALFNVLSVTISVFITILLLPAFSDFVGIPSDFKSLLDKNFAVSIVFFFVVSTILSGIYPAYVISSFYPLRTMKWRGSGENNFFIRKGLVVFQFAMAIGLMIVMVIAHQQLAFMRDKDLGINIDRVVVIKALNFDKETWSNSAGGYVVDSAYVQKTNQFKNELRSLSSIADVTSLSHLPGEVSNWGTEFKVKSIDPKKAFRLKAIGIDYNFLPTLQVKILAGRNFSSDFPSDKGNEGKRAVLINETASKLFGFKTPTDAVHQHIVTYWGADYEIVGVINSFHQLSLKENLQPLYFILQPRALSYYAVNFTGKDVQATLKEIQNSWTRYFPEYPFNYFFLDQYFDRQYQSDQKFSSIIGMFSGLAIFIASLGLFGLTSYAIVQRTKEIGIRKVLGATVLNVITLFTNEFSKLILMASAITIPLVYFGASQWLETYAFRISLEWWIFAVPLIVILVLALITVTLQTMGVAMKNPVESLKHE